MHASPGIGYYGKRLGGYITDVTGGLKDVGSLAWGIYSGLEQQELAEDALKLQKQQIQAQIAGAQAAQEYERQRIAAMAQAQAGDTGRTLPVSAPSGLPWWAIPTGVGVVGLAAIYLITRGGR